MLLRLLACTHLAAVVLHQGSRHVDVVARSRILPGLLEDGATGLDPLGPPGKLHVLDVDQRGVDVLDGQQFVVDVVDLVVFHATLLVKRKNDQKKKYINAIESLAATFFFLYGK